MDVRSVDIVIPALGDLRDLPLHATPLNHNTTLYTVAGHPVPILDAMPIFKLYHEAYHLLSGLFRDAMFANDMAWRRYPTEVGWSFKERKQKLADPYSKVETVPLSLIIMPDEIYKQAAKHPPAFEAWAKLCKRSFEDSEGNAIDAVLASELYIDKVTACIAAGKDSEIYLDEVRRMAHEILHTVARPFAGIKANSFSEGLVELVVRDFLGLQRSLPESTQFLNNFPAPLNNIPTMADMWGGLSTVSSEPTSQNVAYASCFLFCLGLMKTVMDRHVENRVEALQHIIRAVEGYTGEDVMGSLHAILNPPVSHRLMINLNTGQQTLEVSQKGELINYDDLMQGTVMQEAGLAYFREHYIDIAPDPFVTYVKRHLAGNAPALHEIYRK